MLTKSNLKINKYKVEFVDTKEIKYVFSENYGPDKDFFYFTNRYDFHADIIFSCPVSRVKSIELIK